MAIFIQVSALEARTC